MAVNRYKYNKAAKVGRDTIENVEYTRYEYTECEKIKTFKDKIEDLLYDIEYPFIRIKQLIRDAYWDVRYGFQRMFNGYDYVDSFETYAKFIERYHKILTRYRKNHYGYPMNMTEEEWDSIVDEMIYHLYYMDENHVIEELLKDVPDDWIVSDNTSYNVMEKHKNEFFKLFSEYFYDLWD